MYKFKLRLSDRLKEGGGVLGHSDRPEPTRYERTVPEGGGESREVPWVSTQGPSFSDVSWSGSPPEEESL